MATLRQMSPEQKETFLLQALQKMMIGELTQGQLLKRFRKELLRQNQSQFAGLVKISRRTLSDIENDRGDMTIETLNRAFGLFGLKLGLVPKSPAKASRLLTMGASAK